jgi:hypothetical protein
MRRDNFPPLESISIVLGIAASGMVVYVKNYYTSPVCRLKSILQSETGPK